MKITTGPIEKTTAHTTGYDAVMQLTDKAAQHLAIDIESGKQARQCQRKFASKVNRLVRLLARDFPGHEIYLNGATGAQAHTASNADRFRICIWLIRERRIMRSIVVSGSGCFITSARIETSKFAHPGADAFSGIERIVEVPYRSRWQTALKTIKATPYQTFTASAKANLEVAQ